MNRAGISRVLHIADSLYGSVPNAAGLLRRHGIPCLVMLLVQAALIAYWKPSFSSFPIDDPYIHLVYGRSLAHGDPLTFNRGEISLGTSSPLWMLIVSVLFFLDDDPVRLVNMLNLALLVGCAFVVYLLIDVLLEKTDFSSAVKKTAGTLAAVSLLLSGQTQWMACAGMETMLFLLLILLTVHIQCRSGFSNAVAWLLAATLWTRITAFTLLLVSWVREGFSRAAAVRSLAGKAALTLVAYLPWLVLCWTVVGSVFPTTVGGKRATYVPGEPSLTEAARFVYFYLSFLRCTPVHQVLVSVLLVRGVFHGLQLLHALVKRRTVTLSAGGMLSIWSVCHLLLFALTFRTFLHYGRYLMPLSFAATVVVTQMLFLFAQRLSGRAGGWMPLTVLAAMAIGNAFALPGWKTLYHRDVRHLQETHLAAAAWVRDHTPADATIAACDIGALGYISGRRVVDMFGLLDPRMHPYLLRRDIGEYIRKMHVDYILYLQNPNTEYHTRLYLSEYGHDFLLQQRFLKAFTSRPYNQPTVSQAFGIDVYRVLGWLPADDTGRRAQFLLRADEQPPAGMLPGPVDFAGGVRFLGCEVLAERSGDEHLLRRILRVAALGFRMNCFWQKQGSWSDSPAVRITLAEPESAAAWTLVPDSPIAQGLLDGLWYGGEIAREPHFIWVSKDVPPGSYEVRVELFSRDTKTPLLPAAGIPDPQHAYATAARIRILKKTRDSL